MSQKNTKVKIGQVIKAISNRYIVKSGDKTYLAHARGKIKLTAEIFVGDNVSFIDCKPNAIIEEILPRSTVLTRPYVANVDTAIVVIAKEPEPDLALIDKVIINCFKVGIKPILCYNKSDLATTEEITHIFNGYKSFVECIAVSCLDAASLEPLKAIIRGHLVTLAGQSAVGKTSLLNVLLDLHLKTDVLSQKILRGKNTTRHIEIFEAFGGQIVDTCGFSLLELLNIKAEDLKYYYDDFVSLQSSCKFNTCDHINEPDCAILKAVKAGEIDKQRYERYTIIYKELKEAYDKKYD